ncbi:hypothetical protein MSG28_013028 [Choristoneura fumiferana]|uniref:Uncharacterized protein n=1 Tax=Choristoneura fumiferana TaxID=7141 RepID=A0ACC0KRE7_CHOFU|nr:hypothetical protein MSG28_013028 [Choristoneura fumiferana]
MLDWLVDIIIENKKMSPPTEAYTDVVELCGLLQCLGFSVRSLNATEGNASQDAGARTVVISCPASGVQVVLESGSALCSCPPETNQQNSGIWQVSGVIGGKQLDKEFGCSILGSLPKQHRERLSRDLRAMMQCIKEHSVMESEVEVSRDRANKSASMVEIKVSPERRHSIVKADTPTRYRSLDTLTGTREDDQPLPAPGQLQKKLHLNNSADDVADKKPSCHRQSTYTLSSSPGSVRRRNKTSSPLQQPKTVVLENLIAAEKAAEELRQKLASIIKQYGEDGKDDSSMSSLALDVSKISILKGSEPTKTQFASSPNLSTGLGTVYEDQKNKFKRIDSASTSNLVPRKTPNNDGGVASKLRRISPNFFKSKTLSVKDEKLKPQDSKNSKLNCIFKPKPITPKFKSESSPNLSSASKKRFSHIKSTIPRPTPKKD